MPRAIVVLAGAVALWAVAAQGAGAQDINLWPATPPFERGSGFYLSPWKLGAMWLVFLAWVSACDWLSQDVQRLKLGAGVWIPVAFFGFLLALILFWFIPVFFVGLFVLLLGYAVPVISYVVYRNKQVRASSDKVLTPKHLRRWFARKMNAIGIKMAGAEIDPRDRGPDIKYTPMGAASERDDNVNLLTARQSEGYVPSRELIDDALNNRASHVMLDYSAQAVGVRYQVDGVWHDRSPLPREAGDPMLQVFKGLAALKVDDRRSRQAGRFGVQFGKKKLHCKINSQGTKTGERAVLQFDSDAVPFDTLEELGLRPKVQEQLTALLRQNGLFVFSAMPAGGLTTTMDLTLLHLDRFTRHFVEVADSDKPHRDIENVHITDYSTAAGETPQTVLPKLIRTYPDVIVVRDVADLDTLTTLCEQGGEDRLVITSTRAKEAVEALLRLMMLKVPPAEFAPVVNGVLNVRLIRRLCEKCKEAYAPPPEVLKQLGLPAGKIEALYRPPTQPINPKKPDEVCDVCKGVGYYGRTGIFELLVVDDNIRKVLTTAPKLENLRTMARKLRHRGIQEEGVLLVARGVTSIQELLRVLKQ